MHNCLFNCLFLYFLAEKCQCPEKVFLKKVIVLKINIFNYKKSLMLKFPFLNVRFAYFRLKKSFFLSKSSIPYSLQIIPVKKWPNMKSFRSYQIELALFELVRGLKQQTPNFEDYKHILHKMTFYKLGSERKNY